MSEQSEFVAKIKKLGPLPLAERNSVVCAMIGHSRIMSYCFGYWSCGRCDTQIGDSLGSTFDGSNMVVIGHECAKCLANFKSLTWQDKLYAPKPFKEQAA